METINLLIYQLTNDKNVTLTVDISKFIYLKNKSVSLIRMNIKKSALYDFYKILTSPIE